MNEAGTLKVFIHSVPFWVSAPTFSIRSETWPISQLRADQAYIRG